MWLSDSHGEDVKILVTGATGFIGHYVLEHFKKKHRVLGLSRRVDALNDDYVIVKTDYSVLDLKRHLEGVDIILHLAAGRPNNTSSFDLQKNVELDLNLFSAAYDIGVKNIIFISTRGVYGSQPVPWRENMPVMPESFYALAKAQSELLAKFFTCKGMNIKVLRVAQLLGLGEYEGSAINTFIKQAYNNITIELTANGIQREYLYVKDLLIAIDAVLLKPENSGIFNVGSGEIVSLKQIAENVAEAFGRVNFVFESISQTFNEASLMDSTLFSKTFGWTPKYSFKTAMHDIACEVKDPRLVDYYGLSNY
jgi:nucleoside-diphosphate-sugar epimerase